ncbi:MULTISPECIES: replication-associated recombination protein A [unclassified Planococcus (in: firmicutes)]|uniref:replication-associated recombination protein A n=1 Tax=Planococcus TaxID=1372 RepID=UPI000C32EC22|nr:MULTISPECIES: replication-associated recombination protein A [unclassified Planococcus (in: firmicutes)]AUD13707.1 recombinase RarA [Planococcus sp. MB-3u-03]PKG45823.1 recombinase RarA [Planococcus sp. Urea-trap-24]PKG88468.1 recombinase RarA [Planococcus sp. Urea-3u-39]PKH38814.1 recombinase RarA [Planococcus sp. MB-3u-09]
MQNEPLAFRMRPRTIDEVVGQKDVIGPSTALYKMIKSGHVPSMLLYGDPGIGKTSIAHAIAGTSDLPFIALNATTSGKKDVESVVQEARMTGKVLLFLDEIHRFNKLQQDALLPHVESGSIVLIGATTENPFHDVNPAIRSRCGEIKQLKRLTQDDIVELLNSALADEKRGLGREKIRISKEQVTRIAEGTNGDARKALTMLESIVIASDEEDGEYLVDDGIIEQMIKRVGVFGDKKGSHFFNLLSALQKSVRGSDVNAAMYYLAHLLENGDLTAVTRRLLVMAYEDIGLANPAVGGHVLAACQAADRLGLPEARIPLAQAVAEMCLSEKSNSAYRAIDAATAAINKGQVGDIPPHLRDTHYAGSAELGHRGYKYPHDTPIGSFGGWADQDYLPKELKKAEFYKPVVAGEEKKFAGIYEKLKGFRKK